jgi:hypothetical protein
LEAEQVVQADLQSKRDMSRCNKKYHTSHKKCVEPHNNNTQQHRWGANRLWAANAQPSGH